MRLPVLFALCMIVLARESAAQAIEFVRRIGVVDGDPNYVFARPGQIRELPDGNILVIEALDAQLRIYDAEGRFVRSFGGRGAGPGEFLMPFGIIARDSLLEIIDASLRRITTYTVSGRYVTDRPLPAWPVSALSTVRPLQYGFAITAANARYGSGGVFLDVNVQLLRENDARVDTLLTYPSGVVVRRDGSNVRSTTPRLGEGGAWASSGDSMVVVMDALRGVVTWYWVDRGGLREWRRSDLRWRPETVSRADRAEIEDRVRSTQPELRAASLDLIMPDSWGRVSRMVVAGDGTAWLNLTARLERTNDWLLIAPGGRETRRVALPERFSLWSVAGDRLYGVERGEDDVPFVVIYRLPDTSR